ncbi:PR domain zinc finger protein 5-like isoform X3 [Sitophilus oryzae]|uniref:PR domain zinc finger protein 5-like isoform X3 n=1 Tax=Sitophilus oryzae TaxID=7048 RepID=A0A6J2YAL8_SITOR|nr:PR domain zinc finger protein 5-like isoform X3 [Sitophilus oryzae]
MMDNIDEVIDLKQLKEADKKVYKCAISGFQTLHKASLQKHKKTHLAPEDRKLFACIHCDKRYISKQSLRHHLEDNHIDIVSRSKAARKNLHKCSICGYQTRKISCFERHRETHLAPGERQMFACVHCEKKCSEKRRLTDHIIDNHIYHIDSRLKVGQKIIYRCSTCSYQTKNMSNLKRHKDIHLAPEERQIFACAQCDNKYTSNKNLLRHVKDSHIYYRSKEAEKEVYKCAICGYQTLDKPNFYRHEKIHMAPEDRQLFACVHCDKEYTTKQILQRHLEDNHIDSRSQAAEKKVYKCTMCHAQTRKESHLRQHMKIHLAPEDREFFVCTHCDKKYMTKKALKSHLENNHTDSRSQAAKEIVFKCAICDFQTIRELNLHNHKKIHLSREERQLFPCTLCEKKYSTKGYLQSHFINKHSDSRPKEAEQMVFRCAICGFRTLRSTSLRSHKKIHMAPEERQLFACTHCDKTYKSGHFLRRHFEENHVDGRSKAARKNIHKCSTCGYQTPYSTHLQRHQKIHLAPDERQLFACAHCDKKYTEKQRLKVHFDVDHMGSRSEEAEEKVFHCTTCGFQTQYKSNFLSHKKIHLPLKDRQLFACTHCNKRYTTKRGLQRHLEDNHTHIDSRNADCTSSTDEVILDALKIEIDDIALPLDDSKNSECLAVTNDIKSEDFIKTEPEDVAPIMKTDVHDDFKSSENESATRNVKLEDFIKMEPDDDV